MVAEKFDVSDTSVRCWKQAFDWDGRVHERDRTLADNLSGKAENDIVKMKERHLKMARAIQGKFLQRLQNESDTAGVQAADLIRAAEYEAKLLGYDPTGATASKEDVQEVLATVIYALNTKLWAFCPQCHHDHNQQKLDIVGEIQRLASSLEPPIPTTANYQDTTTSPEPPQIATNAPSDPGQPQPTGKAPTGS